MQTTRNASVLAMVVLAALPLFAGGVALTVAVEEQGLPIKIMNATSTTDFAFSDVGVKNTTNRIVRSITFGVVLYDPKAGSRVMPVVLAGKQVLTNIEPGAEATVHPNFMRLTDLLNDLKNRELVSATADLGVTKIEFDDGSSWTFEVQPREGFRAKRN